MREGKSDLYSVNLDGSELTKLTNATIGTMINQPAWSPDGLYILYSKKIGAAPFQLYELELDSGIETQITNDAGFDHFDAAYAP